MPFAYKDLRGRIIAVYGTLGAFAEALGMSRTTLSNKMTNKVPITQEEMTVWSQMLNIPKEQFGNFYFN